MKKPRKKRFSGFSLQESLKVVGVNQLKEWHLEIIPRAPSAYYQQTIVKLKSHFDLSLSEAAKSLLIDALLLEAIDDFKELKIWKDASLQTDALTGTIDYLVAPQGTVYQSPFLCVVEAKKDNFEQGLAQCLVEMQACQWLNKIFKPFEVFGIVTNAIVWRFYKLTPENDVYESSVYAETQLDFILGVLYSIFAQCTINLTTRK
ncbi:hypothetical protein THII_1080 [Thioploca ingrica]|uniref:Uncharacterized protein n=1 Tax=Thioploca ingrica TaxID=40754 RepID=A0A090AIU2_9GAMM|nr:hypothetical protein THII_1080 [Thioploca ingrica]